MIPILYRDNFIAIANKPAGIMVEPDNFGNENVLDNLRKELNPSNHKNFFLQNIHRLDRPVSGALALAFKPAIVKKWNAAFRSKEVEKKYFAIVSNAMPQHKGTLKNWLWKDQENWKSEVRDAAFTGAQEVSLSYEVRAQSGNFFLLDIDLHSGKYHQIRAQLAHVGCAIIGDEKYGSKIPHKENAIALHAHTLAFKHPARGNFMEVKAMVPDEGIWKDFGDVFRV